MDARDSLVGIVILMLRGQAHDSDVEDAPFRAYP
jgi:hypothetical protein